MVLFDDITKKISFLGTKNNKKDAGERVLNLIKMR